MANPNPKSILPSIQIAKPMRSIAGAHPAVPPDQATGLWVTAYAEGVFKVLVPFLKGTLALYFHGANQETRTLQTYCIDWWCLCVLWHGRKLAGPLVGVPGVLLKIAHLPLYVGASLRDSLTLEGI